MSGTPEDTEGDVFDLFEEEPSPPPPAIEEPSPPPVVEPHVEGDVLQELANQVWEIPYSSKGFRVDPDLFMLAVAIEELLTRAGHHSAASAAARWASYEASGRRSSKVEEARARAEALYRDDLEAIGEGRELVFRVENTTLPWKKQ